MVYYNIMYIYNYLKHIKLTLGNSRNTSVSQQPFDTSNFQLTRRVSLSKAVFISVFPIQKYIIYFTKSQGNSLDCLPYKDFYKKKFYNKRGITEIPK